MFRPRNGQDRDRTEARPRLVNTCSLVRQSFHLPTPPERFRSMGTVWWCFIHKPTVHAMLAHVERAPAGSRPLPGLLRSCALAPLVPEQSEGQKCGNIPGSVAARAICTGLGLRTLPCGKRPSAEEGFVDGRHAEIVARRLSSQQRLRHGKSACKHRCGRCEAHRARCLCGQKLHQESTGLDGMPCRSLTGVCWQRSSGWKGTTTIIRFHTHLTSRRSSAAKATGRQAGEPSQATCLTHGCGRS
jgi:hypothetical protein